MTESLAEVEETFVELEEQMLKIVEQTSKFRHLYKEEDELSLKWIVKRPTEVVGLEAKRQAVKAQAAKDIAMA